MVKLSDALRGAADRAPLDGVHIDGTRATRGAARRRGLRAGANGLLGTGAVALIAVGVMGPGSALGGADGAGARNGTQVTAESDVSAREALAPDLAGGSSLAWGLCGTELPAPIDGAQVDAVATLTGEVAPGTQADASLTVATTVTGGVDGTFETFGIDGVVLWNGIVVATLDGNPATAKAREVGTVTLVAGESVTGDVTAVLENCWDGAVLPAADYDLVLTQQFFATATQPGGEGSGEASIEPGSDPGLSPEPVPDELVPTAPADDQSVAEEPAGDTSVTDEPAGDGVSEPSTGSAVAGAGTEFRVVSAPIAFTVPGDAVDNPFAAYLSPEPTAPPVPEPTGGPTSPDPTDPTDPITPGLGTGVLDAATARGLYQDGLRGAWDMAAGSQRWLMANSSAGAAGITWFGCAYDGSSDGRFPAKSAVVDLLDVTVSAPGSIGVSYGWVVDNNPRVQSTVTNTSAWDLPTFWGKGSVQLVLVKDGRAVAEAWPVDPNQYGVAYATDVAMGAPGAMSAQASDGTTSAASSAISIAPAPDQGLASGDSASGTYLWRDLNGCWNGSGQAAVTPGTYTLLAMHQLSVSGASTGWAQSDDATGDLSVDGTFGGGLGFGGLAEARLYPELGEATESTLVEEPDRAIAPPVDMADWAEFQVWTSLGRVTVR